MKESTITILCGILIFSMMFGTGFIMYKSNVNMQIAEKEKDVCSKENAVQILEYINDCVSSLQVEENAYVVSSCRYTAVSIIC